MKNNKKSKYLSMCYVITILISLIFMLSCNKKDIFSNGNKTKNDVIKNNNGVKMEKINGTIEKDISYIYGIPVLEDEIGTLNDLVDRVKNNKEFVSDLKIMEENKEQIIRGYISFKGEDYQVSIAIKNYDIPEMFRYTHSMKEDDFKKLKDSNKGVETGIIFGKSNLDSFHFQLKLMSTLLPDLLGIADFSSETVLSGKWTKMAASSLIPPGPEYIYTIHAVSDDDNSVWMHTHGLRRCGSREVEILNSDKDNYGSQSTMIQIVCKNIITQKYLGEPKEPFKIGMDIIGTWIPVDEALKDFSNDLPGGKNDRNEEIDHETAVLYVYLSDEDIENKKYSHVSALNNELKENPLFYITSEETARMRGLALERWNYAVDALKNPDNKLLMKFGILVDEKYRVEGENNLEHLWFEVKEIKGDKVQCVLINEPYYISTMKENDEMTLDKSQLTDWIIYTKEASIDPDKVYLLDELKKYN